MKRILIADDEMSIRTLIEATLDSPDCSVSTSTGGKEALESAISTPPDLIILDWMMPEISGIEVLKSLRSNARTSHIPVIMLTAMGQQKDRNLGISAGANAFLVKPFSPLQLLETIKQVLGEDEGDDSRRINAQRFAG